MPGEVKQIHKPDYRATCSLALSLSMQQPHSHISFLKPRDYWILRNISPQLHVPSHYFSKHFKGETSIWCARGTQVSQSCFSNCFPSEVNKRVQNFGPATQHQQKFSYTCSPLWVSCGLHSLEQSSPKRAAPLATVQNEGDFSGATRIAELIFYRVGFRMWQDTHLSAKSPISIEKQ